MSVESDIADWERFRDDHLAEYERVNRNKPVVYSDADIKKAFEILSLRGNVACKPSQIGPAPDYKVKAANNHLAKKTVDHITELLVYNGCIEKTLDDMVIDDEKYPERLRDSFRAVYNRIVTGRGDCESGDELYWRIVHDVSSGNQEYKGVIEALLVFFFVRCEVFPMMPGEKEIDLAYGAAN